MQASVCSLSGVQSFNLSSLLSFSLYSSAPPQPVHSPIAAFNSCCDRLSFALVLCVVVHSLSLSCQLTTLLACLHSCVSSSM